MIGEVLLPTLSWLVATLLVGAAVFPLGCRALRPLPDAGAGFVPIVGPLLLAYLTWLPGMLGLVELRTSTLVVILTVLATSAWRWAGRDALEVFRRRRELIVFEGLAFGLLLVGAAFVRAHTPAILGQEKFMDLAFFHAFYRADRLPAEDPWMSGFGMPYYHFGYVIWAMLARLAGVEATVGYNLAMAHVLAATATGAFCLVYGAVAIATRRLPDDTAVRAVAASADAASETFSPDEVADRGAGGVGLVPLAMGALAAALIAFMGNLVAALETAARWGWGDAAFWQRVPVRSLLGELQRDAWPPDWGTLWWRPARVVPTIQPDGINEFPYFSFLLGDLHPHFVALPIELLVLGMALSLLLRGRSSEGGGDAPWEHVVAAALVLGSLVPSNTWDVPVFWGVYAVCFGAAELRSGKPPFRFRPVVETLGAVALLALAMYAPYLIGYSSQSLGLGLVRDGGSPALSMLIVFGPLLLVPIVFLGWAWLTHVPVRERVVRRTWVWLSGLVVSGVGIVAGLALGNPTALWLGALAGLAVSLLAVALTEGWGAVTTFVATLLATGLLALLGCEIAYLSDAFGTRMNTVFKFHYQVWVLLSIAVPLSVVALVRGRLPVEGGVATPPPDAPVRMLGRVLRWGGLGVGALLLALGLVYPVEATLAKTGRFGGTATLDGGQWLRLARPAEHEALRWLRERVAGRPVVLEAVGGDYTEYGRVSAYSGLPTVLGWVGHELQWRGASPELTRRQQDVERMYTTASEVALRELLQRYRVQYLYVGPLEVQRYGVEARHRFEGLPGITPVFRNAEVTIYAVEGG
ncbi:MAG TPA: DUF2298 domain-containing protein [Chloroflexota bacterium]